MVGFGSGLQYPTSLQERSVFCAFLDPWLDFERQCGSSRAVSAGAGVMGMEGPADSEEETTSGWPESIRVLALSVLRTGRVDDTVHVLAGGRDRMSWQPVWGGASVLASVSVVTGATLTLLWSGTRI